jgi:hypothetical protein
MEAVIADMGLGRPRFGHGFLHVSCWEISLDHPCPARDQENQKVLGAMTI